jgi:hypothetical protein
MSVVWETKALAQRLAEDAAILAVIDRRRAVEGDPNIGWAVEQAILRAHLGELEAM